MKNSTLQSYPMKCISRNCNFRDSLYKKYQLEIKRKNNLNTEAILVVMNTTDVVKNSGPYGIWTHDLYDTGTALYQLS